MFYIKTISVELILCLDIFVFPSIDFQTMKTSFNIYVNLKYLTASEGNRYLIQSCKRCNICNQGLNGTKITTKYVKKVKKSIIITEKKAKKAKTCKKSKKKQNPIKKAKKSKKSKKSIFVFSDHNFV